MRYDGRTFILIELLSLAILPCNTPMANYSRILSGFESQNNTFQFLNLLISISARKLEKVSDLVNVKLWQQTLEFIKMNAKMIYFSYS